MVSHPDEVFKRRVISLIGGFLIHIVIGTVYITGNITVYLASYLRQLDSSITISSVGIILPLQIVGTTIALVLGSYLMIKFSPLT